jgi:hypothetical protein
MAESYFQHAEHYFRILNAMSQAQQQQLQHQQRRYQNGPSMMGEQDGGGEGGGSGDQPEVNGHVGANGHALEPSEGPDAGDHQPEPRDLT